MKNFINKHRLIVASGIAFVLIVAVAVISQVVDFTPPDVRAGIELMEQGRLEEAVAQFDAAIRSEPICAVAYANRAKANTLLGRNGDSERDVEIAVEQGFDRNSLEKEIATLKQQASVSP